jgi:hypothetical protein
MAPPVDDTKPVAPKPQLEVTLPPVRRPPVAQAARKPPVPPSAAATQPPITVIAPKLEPPPVVLSPVTVSPPQEQQQPVQEPVQVWSVWSADPAAADDIPDFDDGVQIQNLRMRVAALERRLASTVARYRAELGYTAIPEKALLDNPLGCNFDLKPPEKWSNDEARCAAATLRWMMADSPRYQDFLADLDAAGGTSPIRTLGDLLHVESQAVDAMRGREGVYQVAFRALQTEGQDVADEPAPEGKAVGRSRR